MKKILLTFLFTLTPFSVFAHQGNLDGSNGHNCNVSSCIRDYHYHYNNDWTPVYSPISSQSNNNTRTRNCPKYSSYSASSDECICDTGYKMTSNKTSCLKIPEAPENGYLTERGFACNEGYRRIFDRCEESQLKEIDNEKKSTTSKYVERTNSFTDVNTGSVNYDAVLYMKNKGIVKGYEDGSFKPKNRINRAEFTKIIIGSQFTQNEIDECNSKNIFSDVNESDWFYSYVCVAKNNGIITGYPDGTFAPAKDISFTEASKIVMEAVGERVDSNEVWYKPYVERMGELSAIPTDINQLDSQVTRGQMAEMLYRIKEKKKKTSKKFSDFISEKTTTQVPKKTNTNSKNILVGQYRDWEIVEIKEFEEHLAVNFKIKFKVHKKTYGNTTLRLTQNGNIPEEELGINVALSDSQLTESMKRMGNFNGEKGYIFFKKPTNWSDVELATISRKTDKTDDRKIERVRISKNGNKFTTFSATPFMSDKSAKNYLSSAAYKCALFWSFDGEADDVMTCFNQAVDENLSAAGASNDMKSYVKEELTLDKALQEKDFGTAKDVIRQRRIRLGPIPNYSANNVQAACKDKWKTDFSMIDYCVEQQEEAYSDINWILENSKDIAENDFGEIQLHCADKWDEDFSMIQYCLEQQIKSYRKIKDRYIPSSCSNDWGKDFSMLEYCLEN